MKSDTLSVVREDGRIDKYENVKYSVDQQCLTVIAEKDLSKTLSIKQKDMVCYGPHGWLRVVAENIQA